MVMEEPFMGPLWGNILIILFFGSMTLACFIAMFWFIVHPGEKSRDHTKYDILRHDR